MTVFANRYALRAQVDEANARRLAHLDGPISVFKAMDEARDEWSHSKLKDLLVPQVLQLKVGAQVMLIKNIDETLVNGSLGKVVGFSDMTKNPIVEFVITKRVGKAGRVKKEVVVREVISEKFNVDENADGTAAASRTQVRPWNDGFLMA